MARCLSQGSQLESPTAARHSNSATRTCKPLAADFLHAGIKNSFHERESIESTPLSYDVVSRRSDSLDSAHSTSPLEGHNSGMGTADEAESEVETMYSLEGHTLFEKKCIIINREMDAIGMGRYQWYIWTLCGFGYLLDLMWAQAFGLVLQPLKQELGFAENQSGNIGASFNAGLTAGAAFWGILVDIVGRKWAFNLTVIFSTAFGLALGGANSYTSFLVLTAFVGFGVGGNIPIDTTITLEFIPQVCYFPSTFLQDQRQTNSLCPSRAGDDFSHFYLSFSPLGLSSLPLWRMLSFRPLAASPTFCPRPPCPLATM